MNDLPNDAIEMIIHPPTKDLGDGFTVKRALPDRYKRSVGPFVFFDQMGPAEFRDGQGLGVRPHPHIGLATVTYLFEGEVMHRDTLGSVQPIRPGEVNWMIAGKGIAHSERTSHELRTKGTNLFGIQVWVALPKEKEEMDPLFAHHDEHELPTMEGDGTFLRLIAGTLLGKRSPVRVMSEMFYADLKLSQGAKVSLPPEHEERALYPVEGTFDVGGQSYERGQMIVLKPGAHVTISSKTGARGLLLGGARLEEPRHMFWNFVSSSKDRIEQAKDDWRNGRFGQVPGETEFIPLPDDPPPVKYP